MVNVESMCVCLVQFVRVLITLALEKKPAYREMSSRLLSMVHGHYVNSRDVTKGVRRGGEGRGQRVEGQCW